MIVHITTHSLHSSENRRASYNHQPRHQDDRVWPRVRGGFRWGHYDRYVQYLNARVHGYERALRYMACSRVRTVACNEQTCANTPVPTHNKPINQHVPDLRRHAFPSLPRRFPPFTHERRFVLGLWPTAAPLHGALRRLGQYGEGRCR